MGGATAVPRALWKVCFPSEHRYVFIEIPIFTGTVVVAAVCKIMNSKAAGEERESGLIT